MLLHLHYNTISSFTQRTLRVYLWLEYMAAGSDLLRLPRNNVTKEFSSRQIERAFQELREYEISIKYDRTQDTYRITWPSGVDLEALHAHLKTFNAGQAYNFDTDTLRDLRNLLPDMDPAEFCNAVQSALISAHLSNIKPGNLERWLKRGVRQEYKHEDSSSQNNQANADDQQSTAPKTAKDPRWQEHVKEVARTRPDPNKLYANLPELPKD